MGVIGGGGSGPLSVDELAALNGQTGRADDQWSVENRTFNGHVYASPDAAASARHAHEQAQAAAKAAAEQRQASFESQVRERYLSTGADPASWERDKEHVLREARTQAAVRDGQSAADLSALRYQDMSRAVE